ncbi:LacI family DNA-binding transcriptional regulator [Streptomyces sp. NPDC127172]|uniref:LacI family DNA-binding transcriptional regulator n=1 Tax=Streptomyces sp. NPDC127172 TaxID=3345382 RepID=UPI0036333D4C
MGLLADQQLVTGGLPGGQVDDGRTAGQLGGRVARRDRHGVLRGVSCRAASYGVLRQSPEQTRGPAGTHRVRGTLCRACTDPVGPASSRTPPGTHRARVRRGVADIATAAGVSKPTVSRVLNGHRDVAEATRRRVAGRRLRLVPLRGLPGRTPRGRPRVPARAGLDWPPRSMRAWTSSAATTAPSTSSDSSAAARCPRNASTSPHAACCARSSVSASSRTATWTPTTPLSSAAAGPCAPPTAPPRATTPSSSRTTSSPSTTSTAPSRKPPRSSGSTSRPAEPLPAIVGHPFTEVREQTSGCARYCPASPRVARCTRGPAYSPPRSCWSAASVVSSYADESPVTHLVRWGVHCRRQERPTARQSDARAQMFATNTTEHPRACTPVSYTNRTSG